MIVEHKFQVISKNETFKTDTLCKATHRSYTLEKLGIRHSIYEFIRGSWECIYNF